jgi:hypothetical protein
MNLRNPAWRIAVAVVAVLMLAAPAALGVFMALVPTRGPVAAGLAAVGIELAYLSLALLMLRPELRGHARRVALAAVGTSITLNVLADYSARVPGGLASWAALRSSFDPLALGLAVIESAPLAGLAFALASLLHRLAEQPEPGETHPAEPPPPAWAGPVLVAQPSASWARQEHYPAPVEVGAQDAAVPLAKATKPLVCPACSATLDTPGELGAARRWGHCRNCKPTA